MNVVFLDFYGVVNTCMWDAEGKRCSYGYPMDNKVNNFQAVQWVSEFCQKRNYDIVVSSSWRSHSNYIDCIKNGGLREGINVLGKTPEIPYEEYTCRGDEIKKYLEEHPEVEKFLIFDDDEDMGDYMDHLVQCKYNNGFGMEEYTKAEELDDILSGKSKIEGGNL